MAIEPWELLGRVRAALALRGPTPVEQVRGKDPACVGCPPHLLPGQKVQDPVTGLEGEVIAYARADVPGPVPETPAR